VRITLPASIGMLTGLTSLVLSSNTISGGLDSSLGRLTNLNSLELASNRFTGTVPSTLSQLISLIYLDLRFNKFQFTIPAFVSRMTNLTIAYLDGNEFSGEITSSLCEAFVVRNMTFTMTNNPLFTCYQPRCWRSVSGRWKYIDSLIIECVPTQAPTMVATSAPTAFPTQISSSKSGAFPRLTLRRLWSWWRCSCSRFSGGLTYRNWFGVKAQKVVELPVTALKIILSHKCKGAVDSEAVVLLLEATLPFDSITGEPSPVDVERPGWVDAVQHDEATVVKAVNKVLEKYSSSIRVPKSLLQNKGYKKRFRRL